MKKLAAALLAAFMLFASACSLFGGEPAPTETPAPTEAPTEEPTAEPTAEPTEAPTPEPTYAPTEEPDAFVLPDDASDYTRKVVEAAGKRMDAIIAYISANPIRIGGETHPYAPLNCFEALSPEALEVYNTLLEAASSFEDTAVTCPQQVMKAALKALYTDYPEIETYFTMLEAAEQDPAADIAWESIYSLPESRYLEPAEDMDELKDQVETLKLTAAYIASRIPEGFSPIDKYRALAFYVADNTQYAHVVGELPVYSTTCYGAVVNGYSICQGYAFGFEYLCRTADLDCRHLTNGRSDDQLHYWDVVTLDQGTYFVDVTWCDSGSDSYRDSRFYKWFMFPSDAYHIATDSTMTTGAPFDKTGW